MKSGRLILSAVIMMCIMTICNAQSKTDSLYAGCKPPPLKVAQWLKGGPVSGFRDDHVYIVEFGSVNCPPCRASIPHLTQLAKQYEASLSVISVFVWDKEISKVKRFVQDMDSAIGYHVAADLPDETMANTWMKAAGIEGVPYAFVIGRDKKIAWIGSPFDLDSVVERVVNNRFDPYLAKKQGSEAIYQELQDLRQTGHYRKALRMTDSLLRKNPQGWWAVYKFDLLHEIYPDRAYQFGRDLLANHHDVEPELVKMAGIAAFHEEPDFDLAIAFCERAFDVCKAKDVFWSILSLEASIYGMKKDFKKAAERQQMAIDYLAKYSPEDLSEYKGGMELALADFRKRAGF